MPLFHAFTGCDTVSAFAGKGKESAWDTWNVLPEMTDALAHLSNNPPQDRIPDQCMCLVERFVVVMYDRASEAEKVNAARQQLFSKGSRALENIPPTQAALTQHTRRAIYQAVHCWGQALVAMPELPDPGNWGWKKSSTGWKPLWTTLTDATASCYELIHCSCKKGCRGRCKCTKAGLTCTALCVCGGNCDSAE